MTGRQRLSEIYRRLLELYPDSECSLDNRQDPWRLLVGAILATQCTDKRVNQVTPALFDAYPDVFAMSQATPEQVLPYVKTCGLSNRKPYSLVLSARELVGKYDGRVPDTIEELVQLPGVGRKIANLVVGDCYGKPAVVIDTHAKRLLYRMGITDNTSPDRIEMDVGELLQGEDGSGLCHRLVDHGRAVCTARSPGCQTCGLADICLKRIN